MSGATMPRMTHPVEDAPEEDLLYHYTDSAGLIGIISSSTLWATNAAFLNDTQEMRYGAELIAKAIERERVLRFRNSIGGLTETALKRAAQIVTYLEERYLQTRVSFGPYITCFSRNCDDLGQWRGYAQAGYSIGFDRSTFIDTELLPPAPNPTVRPVQYGNSAEDIAYKYAMSILDLVSTVPGNDELSDRQLFQAVQPADEWIPQLKHRAFQAESEERLWVDAIRDAQFRPSQIGLVPYKTVPINTQAIRTITVGPGPTQELRMNALSVLLEQHFPCTQIRLVSSTIPFRG